MNQEYSVFARELKKKVLASRRVLLHLHPHADGDSLGSALAMKEVVEALGKEADIITGDTGLPSNLTHLPGVEHILNKNFFEVDLSKYDLFIVQDAANEGHISKLKPIVFPPTLTVAVIDHHDTNKGYGALNLVDAMVPATAQLVYEIITLWGIPLTPPSQQIFWLVSTLIRGDSATLKQTCGASRLQQNSMLISSVFLTW